MRPSLPPPPRPGAHASSRSLTAIAPILLYRWHRGLLTAATTGWDSPPPALPDWRLARLAPRSLSALLRLAPLKPLLWMAFFDQSTNLLSAWPQVPLGGA